MAWRQVDLKSRRELRAHDRGLGVQWFDQAVVRAALQGRVLILEGLEKALEGTKRAWRPERGLLGFLGGFV